MDDYSVLEEKHSLKQPGRMMMNTQSKRWTDLFLILGVSVFLGTGCSNSEDDNVVTYAQPSNENREDIAEDFGNALAGNGEGMLGMWQDEGGGMNFTSREGNFEALDDTLTIEHGGFTIVRIRNFFDANGMLSDIFVPDVTVRMEQHLSIEGTHENMSGNRSVSVAHYDTLDVYGLLPAFDELTVNGNGSRNVEGEFQSHFRQNVRTFEAEYEWAVSEVMLSTNHVESHYPLDGIIAVEGVWTNTHTNPGRDVERTVQFSFTVEFNGTRYAELTFEGGATFWIDLENGLCWREHP